MTFQADLINKVVGIASDSWTVTAGRVVPDVTALPFANQGKTLSACILYADLSNSTEMVNNTPRERAAEYYKAFLYCASRLIELNQGTVEAYDGDRVMGVFLGVEKEERAVRASFQLKLAMDTIVNGVFERTYPGTHKDLQYTVGIDTGQVMACKAGVRGTSELVWVGPAANYAAKLNSFPELDHRYPTRITEAVFSALSAWTFNNSGLSVWEGPWERNGVRHYRSLANTQLP
ncbi:adenylate/guanylate cyclase domain-containing protein [Stenotrophomonas indicatrix]|jgi:class 3 adenylate cyclase|uniref:adenylate/guanylate cyclase domain-containing protein n=1 Tax=Stenotrophomonas indicatrix TaxID=2045451 RepID=UPI00242D855E|nr:adenylate/guanylate cyclase domain-containing protein [Stenotrophomonas indicatrix]